MIKYLILFSTIVVFSCNQRESKVVPKFVLDLFEHRNSYLSEFVKDEQKVNQSFSDNSKSAIFNVLNNNSVNVIPSPRGGVYNNQWRILLCHN